MRFWKFFFALFLTVGWIYMIDRPYGQIPPPAKFFSPFDGFWQNAESHERLSPKYPSSIEGLHAPVDVFFDERRVPHVFAQNDEDLIFMQGYITASERLWQMDFQIRAASGRISEIVGPVALDFDRLNRRKGVAYGAKRFTEEILRHEENLSIVNAFTNGVNAYINQLSYRDYPLEFKLLNYAPEEWSLYKTALLLKYMADMLAGHDNDFAYTKALGLLGREMFDMLYPDFFPEESPIIQFPEDKEFILPHIDTPDLNPIFAGYDKFPLPPGPDRVLGSNNWALSGEKTASGNPILCNDPHLALNLPSIWYEMQLSAPDVNVYGITLPGAPGVIIGFNEHIAWGVTNSALDVRDWYKIEFRDDSKQEYLLDGEWKPVTMEIETIYVKNEGVFIDTVYYTHWGPVTFDENFYQHPDFINFACRWAAHDPSEEHMTFMKLNRAKNLDDYLDALNHFHCPGQNIVFASKTGDIALTHQGKFPIRWPEQGKFLMDGTSSKYAWQGFIPFEDLPREINPPKGFVSSANQHPTDSTYPYFYTANMFEAFRNRRINQLLEEAQNVTMKDMQDMLSDNYNMLAADIVPLLLHSLNKQHLTDANAQEWITEMENWDFYNEAEYLQPTFFEIWYDTLEHLLWGDLKAKEPAFIYPNQIVTIALMKTYIDSLWIVNVNGNELFTESIIRNAFEDALTTLNVWKNNTQKEPRWATYKATRLAHLAMIDAFYVRNLPIGGNKHIINATSRTHGPSWKMVVELGEEIKAKGIYPGGQSGNPGSRHYANFAMDWANGKMYDLILLYSNEDERTHSMTQHNFVP